MKAMSVGPHFICFFWGLGFFGQASGSDTPLRVLPGHFGPVLGLAFNSDGTTLATASGDVQFWDFDSGVMRRKLSDLGSEAYAVDISSDDSMFAIGTAGSTDDNTPNPPLMEAKIWDYGQNTVLQTIGLEKHRLQEGVRAVAFSPDNTMLAVGGSNHAEDPVKLFNVSTGNLIREFSNREGNVRHLVFNSAGTMLCVCRQPNRVELWNLKSFEKMHEFEGNRGEKIGLSPNGMRLAYGHSDKSIRIMDVVTGELVLTLAGHDQVHSWGYAMSFAFSPDGSVLASGSGDSTIILWSATDGTKLRTIRGHNEYVCSLAFSPDGSKLVSGADEVQAKIWDVSDVTGASGSSDASGTSGTIGTSGNQANAPTSGTASVTVVLALLFATSL